MTSKDLEAELEKDPFVPLQVHLVSGKTLHVPAPGTAWLLQDAVLIFRNARPATARAEGYDVIALRNIERIEQAPRGMRRGPKRRG